MRLFIFAFIAVVVVGVDLRADIGPEVRMKDGRRYPKPGERFLQVAEISDESSPSSSASGRIYPKPSISDDVIDVKRKMKRQKRVPQPAAWLQSMDEDLEIVAALKREMIKRQKQRVPMPAFGKAREEKRQKQRVPMPAFGKAHEEKRQKQRVPMPAFGKAHEEKRQKQRVPMPAFGKAREEKRQKQRVPMPAFGKAREEKLEKDKRQRDEPDWDWQITCGEKHIARQESEAGCNETLKEYRDMGMCPGEHGHCDYIPWKWVVHCDTDYHYASEDECKIVRDAIASCNGQTCDPRDGQNKNIIAKKSKTHVEIHMNF